MTNKKHSKENISDRLYDLLEKFKNTYELKIGKKLVNLTKE